MFAVSAENFTASGTADILLDEYIPLWGCLVTLLSDNCQQFTSKLATVVYDRVGTRKVNTSAYHPCTNGGGNDGVGVAKGTVFQETRPGACFKTGDSVKEKLGGLP